jgi:hypothetical protein
VEARYREVVRLLEEEIAEVEAEFAEEVEAQEEKDAIERDACLAPTGGTWEVLLQQEAVLDRSIDRKVRILLAMRKDHARMLKEAASPPGDETDDREGRAERRSAPESKLAGLDGAEVAPNFSSADASLKASATQTESQEEENAAETPKSPEQSENVIENKAPAAEGVAA